MKKDICEKPQMAVEAAQAKKGKPWILELLIFAAVFIVSQLAMLIIMVPASYVLLFNDKAYTDALKAGDATAAMNASVAISLTDSYTVLMLLSEILMILIILLFCKLLQKRKMRTVGFVKKGMVKEYLIGMVAGFAVFSLIVLCSVLSGGMTIDGISPNLSIGFLALYFIGFMIQGMAEEVLCRGYFMISYARRYPVYAAVLANALMFASLHLNNPGISVIAFINLSLFGIFASLYFLHRGNIWGIGAFHSVWNFVQGNFYGIKVSGMDVSSLFGSTMAEGKNLLNGGDFGLEGSIFTTVVLGVCIVVLLYFLHKKHPATDKPLQGDSIEAVA